MSIEVTAMLSKVIFESDKGDYVVAEFIDSNSALRFKASGRILTLGKKDSHQVYRLFGDWQNAPKYGNTFVVVYSEPQRPEKISGIVPFLSNNVKGVGELTAKKMLEHLGVRSMEALVRICKEEPQRIQEFFKAKKDVAQSVVSLVTGDEIYRSIMIFLHEHNIAPNFARRIFERYGAQALQFLTENPYRLISDFRNVGFLKADAIAQKLGIESTSPFRIEAAAIYAIESAESDGHTCLPRNLLVDKSCDVLGGKLDPQFSFDFVLQELRSIYKRNKDAGTLRFVIRTLGVCPKTMQQREPFFYLPKTMDTEDSVAEHCLTLLSSQNIGREKKERDLQEKKTTLGEMVPEIPWERLSDEQRLAVETSVGARFMILTGGPGCGKTFVLKAIFKVQRALNRRVALCAPTGLAAKRMTNSIESQASTLHKMLRIGGRPSTQDPDGQGGEGALENVDLVICDEASMLSLDLFHTLLEALGPKRRLILVGDVDQLPSVGAGNCLRDLIGSGKIPVARLTKIFRQSSESPIPLAAREIISGRKPEFTLVSRSWEFPQKEAFAFVPCAANRFFEVLVPFLMNTVRDIYGLDPVKDVQILVPMRKSDVGQDNINKILQMELNPPRPEKAECPLGHGVLLRVGDKVMQTRNNYEKEVFNGDLGFCSAIRKEKDKLEVDILFDDKLVTLEEDDLDDLQLCYAMTIHKSQGSEFPLCIIPMFSAYYSMLDRNLLYTAVTRASRFAIVFGEEWAIKKAISSMQSFRRHTCLDVLIQENQN